MANIRISGLCRRFSQYFAVSDLELNVASGEFLTLLGPSGSGKTTTLRMIAGLERPDAGSIQVGNRTMNGPGIFVPPHQRNMGMVFQSYAVWPHRTVYRNVAFPLQVKRVPAAEERARVERILDLVELPASEFGERFASQLSGGQQQRVALARALVAEPDVILYDEPLSNLDAKLRETMRMLLRSIHNRISTTAVYVTHDQTEAMVLSDRICVMSKGRIVQQASPRELYEHPSDLFVTEFIGGTNIIAIETLDRAKGEIRLPGGSLLRVPPWTNQAASKLAVRFHHVGLLPAGTAAENALDATVQDCVFQGDRMRLTLRVCDALTLTAEAVAAPGLPDPGASVRAVLPANLCIII
jgi:ABC-type Fe3+/spermidine/putrescine transport system ATPase subunit